MTMNEQQIGDALRALTSALTEKLGRYPALGPYLSVDETGKCSINIYADRIDHYKCTGHATGDTFAEAIDAAWSIVNAIQSCEDEAKASSAVAKLEAENQRLRAALQRAYDHVLRDAPDWFERHSHEQRALEIERSAARDALRNTMGDD